MKTKSRVVSKSRSPYFSTSLKIITKMMKIIPSPFEKKKNAYDASNNPWNFPIPRFLSHVLEPITSDQFSCKDVTEPREQQCRPARLRVKLFSTRRSVFLIVRGGGTKKTPFLIPAVALFRFEQALYSDWIAVSWQRFIDSVFFSLLFLTQCVYEVHSRGWIAARFNSDLQTLDSFRVGLFFSPLPAFADKFPPLLALSDSSVSQAKWNIGNRKSSAPTSIRPNWRIFKSVRRSYRYGLSLIREIDNGNKHGQYVWRRLVGCNSRY